MLQLSTLRENTDAVIAGLEKKYVTDARAQVEKILALDARRRALLQESEQDASEANELARQIGTLMKGGKREESEALKAQTAVLKERAKETGPALAAVEQEQEKEHDDTEQADGVGVTLLLAFEKLGRDQSRDEQLPGRAQEFPFQVEGVVPQLAQQAAHAHLAVRIALAALRTKLCLVGQGVKTVAAIVFQATGAGKGGEQRGGAAQKYNDFLNAGAGKSMRLLTLAFQPV